MADIMEIPCPDCDKVMKLPAEMAGKKVRCKACGHVFRVEGAGAEASARSVKAKAKPPAKGKADPKAAGKAKGKTADDDEPDANPYGLTEEYLGPRCPFCAHSMEEGDIICLNCGYNTVTRMRQESKKVFARTGTDWFLWLFPAIMCVITTLSLAALDVWYVMKVPTEADNQEFIKWALFHKGVKLWVVIITIFVMFFAVKFSIKRLIFHPLPPEREKQDTRNIFVILGTLCVGVLLFVAISAWFVYILAEGDIPNPWFFAPLYSVALGMIVGPLQYNI